MRVDAVDPVKLKLRVRLTDIVHDRVLGSVGVGVGVALPVEVVVAVAGAVEVAVVPGVLVSVLEVALV